jgi:ribosomal protein L37E
MGGDLVQRASCPRCGRKSVLYNGNYWCHECGWVMPERQTEAHRQIIKAYLIQRHQEAEAKGDEREKARMAEYLLDYADTIQGERQQ